MAEHAEERKMTTETQHADEITAMRARRAEITTERDRLHAQPEGEARDIRIDGIESELDSMDARLAELGLPLDTVA